MTPTIRPWAPADLEGVPALILPIQTAEFGLPANFPVFALDKRFYRLAL